MSNRRKTGRPIRFGVFELDLRAGELRKYGVKLKLQDKPLALLSILLERPVLDLTLLAEAFDHRLAGRRRGLTNPFIGDLPEVASGTL